MGIPHLGFIGRPAMMVDRFFKGPWAAFFVITSTAALGGFIARFFIAPALID